MSDMPAQHADYLADFYLHLIKRGVDGDVAGAMTADLNRALLAGTTSLPEPTKDQMKAELAAAAEAKRHKRAAETS